MPGLYATLCHAYCIAHSPLMTLPWPGRWFFYRVSGAKDKDLIMHLVNAGSSSFPEAWEGYQARGLTLAVPAPRAGIPPWDRHSVHRLQQGRDQRQA